MDLPCLPPGGTDFPAPDQALTDPSGLLAFGGDLSPAQLLAAYRVGAFPWYSEPNPILWWHPDPRAVILPETLHISRSLAKLLRQRRFRITVDHAFDAVITACASDASIHREGGTWLTPAMQTAYRRLHQQGTAHSVEVWQGGCLVGGMYGLAMGCVFHGESMFSLAPNASRVALVSFANWLFNIGFMVLDCQVINPHTMTLGAIEISREAFLAYLKANQLPVPVDAWKRVLCEQG